MTMTLIVLSVFGPLGQTTPFYESKGDLMYFLGEEGDKVPVTTPAQWERRRAHILANMQEVMGPLPEHDHVGPPEFEVLDETDHPAYTIKNIRYAVESWDSVPALLFLPKRAPDAGPGPAMLCLHPTSPLGKRICAGAGEKPNRNYAVELAERGYVTLAPDYPGFGDYGEARTRLYEEGYVSCTMKGIWNHIRAVDLLAALPEVDPERIGCIGHSLGGHNTLFAGVFDSRIRVMVTSCGFTTFPKYMKGDLTGWTHDGYMPRIASAYEKDPAKMPFDFTEVLGALAPRALFVCAPLNDDNFEVSGVRDAMAAAQPVYDLYQTGNRIKAVYPEAGHDFPNEARKQAYAFVDAIINSGDGGS